MAQPLTEEELYQKTPQQLTSLLYEACLNKLERSCDALKQGRSLEANGLLQQSNDILYRLGAGLNYEAGIIADQLDLLYNYMVNRLVEANIHKDYNLVDEVRILLTTIAESWEAANQKGKDQQTTMHKMQARAYEPGLPYHKSSVNRME